MGEKNKKILTTIVFVFLLGVIFYFYQYYFDRGSAMYLCPDGSVQDVGKEGCKKLDTPTSAIFSVDKTLGKAPLNVTFLVKYMGLGDHWVDFGDGQKETIACLEYKPETDGCLSFNSVISHIYSKQGEYVATYMEGDIGPSGKIERVLHSITISVK